MSAVESWASFPSSLQARQSYGEALVGWRRPFPLRLASKWPENCFVTNRAIFGHFLLIPLAHKKLEKAMPLCLADDFTQNPQRLRKLGKFGVILRIFGPNRHLR